MWLMRTKLVFAMIACAFAAATSGCTAAASAPPLKSENASNLAPPASPKNENDANLNMASVLDKLQQVRTIDPAAEQKLLDELRRTPAESWPLVAEQFRASLAYREQLIGDNAPKRLDPAAGGEASTEPQSGQINPRSLGDGASQLAKTAPDRTQVESAEQIAPAESFSHGTADPIATTAAAPAVIQAKLDAVAEPTISEPTGAAVDSDWQKLVDRAAADLSRRLAESPTTTAEVHQHVSLRLLQLLAGNTEQALEPIPHIAPVEQDYWSRQLFALATYLDHHSQPDDKRRAAASVAHLDEAVSHLRELGPLALRNLSFCKNVYGYGAIESYDSERFAPGEQVSLYVEVENYHSQSTEKGFRTLLGSSYELLNEEGKRVGGGDFPDVDDYCRSRRRDFHIQYGVALPENISSGRYELQLVVKDRQSDKMGHATATFEIRGTRP